MIAQAISALLLGKSLSSIIVPGLISIFNLNFFDYGSVPSVTADISVRKTYDLLEFITSIFVSLLIYCVLYFFHMRFKSKKIPSWFLLIFSFLFWFQTIFSVFSGKSLLILLLLVITAYITATTIKSKSGKIEIDWVVVANGIFLGFWLLLIANFRKDLPVLGPLFLFLTPIIYLFLWQRKINFVRRRLNILFALGILFVFRLDLLMVLGLIAMFLILLEKNFLNPENNSYAWDHFIYPAAIIAILFFNPLFYAGKFDFIEEGFWLGWIARLKQGQALYRDVAVYHGPGLVVLMGKFMSFFNYSFESFRLFLELIKIVGFVFIFYLSDQLLKNKWNKIFLLIIIASISETLVKNNVEFRLGLGALAIVLWWLSVKRKNKLFLLLSGAAVFIAIITSLEVGLASFLAITAAMVLQKKDKIKNLSVFVAGLCIVGVPFAVIGFINGSLSPMIEQLVFYAKAFSSGYFNTPMVRPPESAYLHWSLLIDYFGSEAFAWDFSFMVLGGSIMFIIAKILGNKKLENREILFGALVIFTLVLSRSALGRSDWYHLLFVLIPALIIFLYLIENSKTKNLSLIVLLLLTSLVFKTEVHQKFLSRLFYNWQNYGRLGSDYKAFPVGDQKIWTLDEEGAGAGEIGKIVEYLGRNIQSQEIFTYPWMPEIYYFTGLKNATSMDTPYAFYSPEYQSLVVEELAAKKPVIVYNPLRSFGGLDEKSLPDITKFIKENYLQVDEIGSFSILKPKQ